MKDVMIDVFYEFSSLWMFTTVYEGRSKTHIIKSCRRRFFFNLECLKPASRKSRARPAQGPRKAS